MADDLEPHAPDVSPNNSVNVDRSMYASRLEGRMVSEAGSTSVVLGIDVLR